MELLAPVNTNTLDAALAAGANAVYFGLKRLNARRGAANFTQSTLPEAVAKIHASGAKAHLTLNIDLTSRETGLAARTLAFAQECGVDAVIVRDPAILAWRPFFPKLEFHLSTQAGISSSAGVKMAQELGCDRAVLARELTRHEIAACCRVPGIDIEVFVQGALCFCASGRCLLSSWGGGRSGNRGACASPCRVGWKSCAAPDDKEAHPLSMKDLCLVEHLPELETMGVASLKIEGRLKSTDWVSKAVALYRKAADREEDLAELRQQAVVLGGYTGRALTEAYYEEHFQGLTEGTLGRAKYTPELFHTDPDSEETPNLKIRLTRDEKGGLCFQCSYADAKAVCRIPPQRIANPRRAITLKDLLDNVLGALPKDAATELQSDDEALDPEKTLLPRRCEEMLLQQLTDFLRQAGKEDDGNIRAVLPKPLVETQQLGGRSKQNRRTLGTPANLVRIRPAQIPALLNAWESLGMPHNARIVLALPADTTIAALEVALAKLPDDLRRTAILALPAVCYEESLPEWSRIAHYAADHDLVVEANSWDTLYLARTSGAAFATGAGLAVLNPLAARMLAAQGAQWCTATCEADRKQLEELTQLCEVPLSLVIYGRPALMTTRAQLPTPFAPQANGASGTPFQDARKTRLKAFADGEITLLRPEEPYDWRAIRTAAIATAFLELDLTAEENATPRQPAEKPFLFNFDRQLR